MTILVLKVPKDRLALGLRLLFRYPNLIDHTEHKRTFLVITYKLHAGILKPMSLWGNLKLVCNVNSCRGTLMLKILDKRHNGVS